MKEMVTSVMLPWASAGINSGEMGVSMMSSKVADALLIVFDIPMVVTGLGLDMFVHRNAFYDAPAQPGIFYNALSRLDFVDCPHLTVRNVVQCVDNASGTSLLDVLKADRVGRTIPTPCFFGKYHCSEIEFLY